MSRPSGCLQRVGLCAALALALALSACARCPDGTGPGQVFFPGSMSCESVDSVKSRPDYADLPLLAALSASVYQVDPATRQNEPGVVEYKTLAQYCREGYAEKEVYRPDWLTPLGTGLYPRVPAAHGRDLAGLGYQVLAQERPGKPSLVYIVFRGTDDEIGDWFSNFRWATRLVPGVNDEYDQLLRNLTALGENIHAAFGGNATIATLGHSLGGGLAQMAAYGFPWGAQTTNVDRVYAFDPSPVTGFYSVEQWLRERNATGMRIYRVYDQGEVLAILRLGMKGLYPVSREDPAITEARFNLLAGSSIARHNMRALACKLWTQYGRPEPGPRP